MVTGDKRTCRDYVFLSTLKRTKAFVFVLDSLNETSPERKAQCVISHYSEMVALTEAARGPRMWIESKGSIEEFNFRKDYARMRRKMGE